MIEDDNDDDASACPYCQGDDQCTHLLVSVNTTFRSADAGVLSRSFNKRWSEICEEGGDDFDEREPFEDLLSEVDNLADAVCEFDIDAGPGWVLRRRKLFHQDRSKNAVGIGAVFKFVKPSGMTP